MIDKKIKIKEQGRNSIKNSHLHRIPPTPTICQGPNQNQETNDIYNDQFMTVQDELRRQQQTHLTICY